MERVEAPWTAEQVESLNQYQACGFFHEFTGHRKEDGAQVTLIATADGWVEEESGPVVQTWAHKFMTDGSWRTMIPAWVKT